LKPVISDKGDFLREDDKAPMCKFRMYRIFPLFLLVPMLLSCAGLAEKVRLSEFDTTFEIYDITLRRSQFHAVQNFIDPAYRDQDLNFDTYKNVKVVDFTVTHVKVSEDRFNVDQAVQLQYFLLDRNILKTIEYRQTWRFDEQKKKWLLQTPLPNFSP